MGKKSQLPFVSICTPTFNRRPFINNIIQCFKNQTYPQHKMEWIIVDDGTDKVKDIFLNSGIQNIRYFEVDHKMPLGEKRNYMHKHATGDFIVYMDDDDYYPPERVSHSVEMLQQSSTALCAGSSEIYIYFKGMDKMIQCGPYGPNHSTAGTFAFKKELLDITRYEDGAAIAEERAFLKDYTIPFVQLDPMKTILVFSHEHNTFDKRKMFEMNQDPRFFKESGKVVTNFIRQKREKNIMKFFMEDIDGLLDNYDPGKPNMKPDVMKQIKEIEAKREQQMEELRKQQADNSPIILKQNGQDIQLTSQQIVDIIKQQQGQINELNTRLQQQPQQQLQQPSNVAELERFVQLLQDKISSNMKELLSLKKENKELKNTIEIMKGTNTSSTLPLPTPPIESKSVSFAEPDPTVIMSKTEPVLLA